jgi:hypothetical protein
MEPVRVAALPESAFNKHRPPSDLLQSQLKHFRHLEKKLDLGLDPALGKRLGTENGAAIYIAAISRALRSRALAAKEPSGIAVMPSPPPASEPLSLAASADPAPPAPTAKTTS